MNWFQELACDILRLDKYRGASHSNGFYKEFSPLSDFSHFSKTDKINIVFSNPAVLKVFSICCNMFSMGKIYVYPKKGNRKPILDDPFLDFINNPNMFQNRNQFLFDFMFWKMIGNAYAYIESRLIENDNNKGYFLDSEQMNFSPEFDKYRDAIVLSKSMQESINNLEIIYQYHSGGSMSMRWKNILHVPDFSGGSGNWFKGRSKLDALFEVICNSSEALKSKNINIRYAGKFMVAGQQDPNDVSKVPLSNAEKTDIETKMNGRKSVHAFKSMIDVKRFIEKYDVLKALDDSYLSDYFVIGSMFDIPKDVLEAFNSGTYENQEKARGALVSYTLAPSGEILMNAFAKWFGYDNKEIVIDWEHLPFMQVFAKERAETEFKKTQSLINLMKAGVDVSEINSILDTEFTNLDYEGLKKQQPDGQVGGNSGQSEQS